MNALRRLTRLPESTVRRALDELEALGGIEPSITGHPVTWGPTSMLKRTWWVLDSETPPPPLAIVAPEAVAPASQTVSDSRLEFDEFDPQGEPEAETEAGLARVIERFPGAISP
jgi:hypothetical protein